MRLVADLHLHSRYAEGVSRAMTIEGIALWAQRKGIDLLGTGDGLQADWLGEVEAATYEAEPGLYALRPEVEERVWAKLPAALRRPLRFVVSTEVCAAPPPRKEIEGIHYLIYFPSFEQARRFRESVGRHGDLSAGRPTLNLNSLQLLERVVAHGPDCHFAPAHVFNPWFSALGTVGGGYSLDELFGDLTPHLLAVEMGLTSIPDTCRRLSSLDGLSLLACSDAHSLEKLGREYTEVEIEPSYHALFAALREGSREQILRQVKYPLQRAKYFLNWCGPCQKSFDAVTCPVCGRRLVEGSRDRLEKVADRTTPLVAQNAPPFQERLPLLEVIAALLQRKEDSEAVKRIYHPLIERVGHERYILTEAPEEEIGEVATPQLARAIAAQREANTAFFAPRIAGPRVASAAQQALFELG